MIASSIDVMNTEILSEGFIPIDKKRCRQGFHDREGNFPNKRAR